MKRMLTVLSVSFLIGVLLTGCGYFEVKSDPKATKESTVSSSIAVKPEPTKNGSTKEANSEDVLAKQAPSTSTTKSTTEGSKVKPPNSHAGDVTVNPNSPYPDYCELLAKYLNQKFDTNLFKHITIEDLQMYAKQTNPKYEFGEVTLNVEHVKGMVSKYQEGKNKLYIRFEIHPDGSKYFDSMDFSPFNKEEK
jgi:hypothetical protein